MLLLILPGIAFPAVPHQSAGQKPPPQAEGGIQMPRAADFGTVEQHLRKAEASRIEGVRTGNATFFEEARGASLEALRLAPGNLQAQRLRIQALLGLEEYREALSHARELNRKVPDDIEGYGLVADAGMAMGDYGQAEEAVQWMLDLRPQHFAALMRGARLRQLFGDLDGAVQFLNDAWPSIDPQRSDARAQTLTHLAELLHQKGSSGEAEKLLRRALELFPDFHPALCSLATLSLAQDRDDEAIELLRKRSRNDPSASARYDLCTALAATEQEEEAVRCFQEFEQAAAAEIEQAANANVELVFYYTDHRRAPEKALLIARREIQRRQDVRTRHALAWALHANGRDAEAWKEMESLLALGLRDPLILRQAEIIRKAL